MLDQPHPVPIRTIAVTIALVVATVVGLYLFVLLARIEALLIVSAFFAIVLTPPVDFVRRHLRLGVGWSTLVVFLTLLALLVAMMYAFIRPLVDQTQKFVDHFPEYVEEARAGEGPVGGLVKRYDLDEKIDENRDKIDEAISSIGDDAARLGGRLIAGLVSLLTIMVLAFMMIVYGPGLLAGAVSTLTPQRRERVTAVARDCARALTGYVMGNLLISVIAGTITFVALWIFGVPFRGVLALWVGFADIIPLVGATLGAIPTVAVAFLHSTTAGIGMLIVYVVYQQFENHVLQPAVMSKTVQINQLFVLVSVLIGVELFGFLGALLAIPAAGVLQVIARDLWDHRAGRLKSEPTIGEDEVPLSEVEAGDAGAAEKAGEPSDAH